MAFCQNCGNEINSGARFCQHCGTGQAAAGGIQGATAAPGYTNGTRKDPGVAVLLSFVWSGAGQVYQAAEIPPARIDLSHRPFT